MIMFQLMPTSDIYKYILTTVYLYSFYSYSDYYSYCTKILVIS